MNIEAKGHLSKKEIVRAVVEGGDLTESLQDHLSTCEFCRAEKERLEMRLSRLGDEAERLAPFPGRRVEIPVRKPLRKPEPGMWHWRRSLAAGAAALMVMALLWWQPLGTTPPEETLSASERGRDERLMAEILISDENPLPQIYTYISGEDIPDEMEEFTDFVIPAPKDETPYRETTREVYYVT